MASNQFSRALLAGIGVLGLSATMVAATFVNEADAETSSASTSHNALLVISSNTHLVLRNRHVSSLQSDGSTMVCGSVMTTPFVAIGLNCERA